MKHTVYIREGIDASVDDIWQFVREFNGLPDWNPAIKASSIELGDGESLGSIRRLTLDADAYVREKLLKLDDASHTVGYSIIESSFPVESYIAGIQLSTHGDQTVCEWWADFDTSLQGDERQGLIDGIGEGVFRAGFLCIAEKIRSRADLTC